MRVLVALALLLAAGAARAETRVTFLTDWKAEAEHGGFYQAVATGLYARRGLDVVIRMGGPGIDTQPLIAAGAVDMAVGSNGFFPLNLLRAGAKVKAVMAAFQKDPQILMTHPRPDVRALADLKGKPVMLANASVGAFWVWLKAKYGFSDTQVRPYTFNMAPFLVDRNAVQQGYVTSEPYQVQKAGLTPQVFLLADDGYPSYATMVLVPEKTIAAKPEIVQAFVDASIEGWRDYLHGDSAAANALIKKANPEMDDDLLAYGLAKLKEHGIVDGGDAATLGIGAMTETRWQAFFDTMAGQGVYPPDLPWREAYTTRFLAKPGR